MERIYRIESVDAYRHTWLHETIHGILIEIECALQASEGNRTFLLLRPYFQEPAHHGLVQTQISRCSQ